MKQFIPGLLILALVFSGCDKDDDSSDNMKTITQTVIDNPDFSILKAAVVRANLATALSSGSLTVFAPDNAAFAAAGITEATINSLPVATLDSILKYHVVGARVNASGVPASDTVKTLLGLNIYASSNPNGVFTNGIRVKQADVPASNGVIHVISNVLMPPTKSIAQIAAGDTTFSLLVAAVQRAGLLNAVSGPGKFTVFAPTNTAFRAAGFNSAADINAAPEGVIANIVKYHVLTTNVFAGDLSNDARVTSLQGGTLTITLPPARVKVSTNTHVAANISAVDILATNGVVHVIDKVLVP